MPEMPDPAEKGTKPPEIKVQGLTGAGWIAAIKENPVRSVPGGAGYLMVLHYEVRIAELEREANLARSTQPH